MKFLVSDPRTSELLNPKHPDHTIYSHFIWMADKHVDGTVRGMLCSLICQILESDKDGYLVDALSQNHSAASAFHYRQNPNEWDIKELQIVLQEIISFHRGFVLIFLDGLDELDKLALGNFVKTKMASSRNVRFCISSRPDPEEKLLMDRYPTIELQKLTRNDLQVVAEESLSEYFGQVIRELSEKERERLIDVVVDKADGVFLWVTLALARIKRGAIACDTADQILESLKDTPYELNDLYSKMWGRLGAEPKQHQKDAFFVFASLLLWKDVCSESEPLLSTHLTLCRDGLSASLFKKLMGGKLDFFQSQEFLDACKNNQRQVESHCAGLIEFSSIENSFYTETLLKESSKHDPRMLVVDFVHRSLRDFLLDDNKSLLDYSSTETVCAAVFRAMVGYAAISSEVTDAGFNSYFFLGRDSWDPMELEAASPVTINAEVYNGYRMSIWNSKDHMHLSMALKCCHWWMQESEQIKLNQNSKTSLWSDQYRQNVKLLENLFDTHKLSNFLEMMAIHCNDFRSAIEDSLSRYPISTYLIWQRLDNTGIRHYGYVPSKDRDYLKILEQADMTWAYPHTIGAAGHAIPQLLTLPEAVATDQCFFGLDEEVILLQRLKQSPDRWILGSVLLVDSQGGCFGTRCGVTLPSFVPDSPPECYEIVFRVNAAFSLNRIITGMLKVSCPYYGNPWSQQQRNELEKLLCFETEEVMEILLVGHSSKFHIKSGDRTVVLNPREFRHLCRSWDPILNTSAIETHNTMVEERRPRYVAPTRSDSEAITKQLDPGLLMGSCVGAYDMCYRHKCADEHMLDVEFREKLQRLKQGRKDKVNAIKTIITTVCSGEQGRIFDIPGYLRSRGHYIPTEHDLLEFLEAESTLDRILVLERLNREKADLESRME